MAAVGLSACCAVTLGQSATQPAVFLVHGLRKTCTAITQLDSALSSGYQPFFAQWTDKDYADALVWAEACSSYGWHIPGQPRIVSLHQQRDKALGPLPVDVAAAPTRVVPAAPIRVVPAAPIRVAPAASLRVVPDLPPPLSADSGVPPRFKWGTLHDIPADGSDVIGFDATVVAHHKDTLFDIARRYGLGYEEIRQANPSVDMWLPGEGTRVVLPGRHRLPPGPREGLVVNVAEYRLYYFPTSSANEKPKVITFPISIGKTGERTPLGATFITAKVDHPSWHPPASVRREHLARGEPLPTVVGPGPDNPLGEFMMRLNFGDGSYEIHGTNNPLSVGMANTNGCIGMYPEDVASLFVLVSVGTPVHVVDKPLTMAAEARRSAGPRLN